MYLLAAVHLIGSADFRAAITELNGAVSMLWPLPCARPDTRRRSLVPTRAWSCRANDIERRSCGRGAQKFAWSMRQWRRERESGRVTTTSRVHCESK
jgi:hypothetical protein